MSQKQGEQSLEALLNKDGCYKECSHETQTGKDHGRDWLWIPPADILDWDWLAAWGRGKTYIIHITGSNI